MAKRLYISVSDLTAERVRRLADGEFSGDVSALVASLVDREARRVESLDAVAEWEAEHGEISPAEITAARRRWLR
ncbi:hypothetical protein [Miltoncostaea oceani]|uniref:hypothetical protein n=1 Tax=Miltoncostaea oceani TaxID=2843216 RepID=UPI001C3D19DC|nr:hypothetical protein [Miltoncostaea oceani]